MRQGGRRFSVRVMHLKTRLPIFVVQSRSAMNQRMWGTSRSWKKYENRFSLIFILQNEYSPASNLLVHWTQFRFLISGLFCLFCFVLFSKQFSLFESSKFLCSTNRMLINCSPTEPCLENMLWGYFRFSFFKTFKERTCYTILFT